MKLFFIGWADINQELVDLVEDLKKRGHEIVYWSRDNKLFEVDKKRFPGTIFHDYIDATTGKPAKGMEENEFSPPGEELLKQLYESESIILTMMDKRYSYLSLAERKHFYYHLVGYWNGILKKFRPDAIIFPDTPHTVYDFIIFSLAKLLLIKTITFNYTWIGDRALLINQYTEGCVELRQAMLTNNINYEISDLPTDLREYYLKQIGQIIENTTPSYVPDYINAFSGINKVFIKLKALWYWVKHPDFFSQLFKSLAKFFKKNLKQEYLEFQEKNLDLNANYVYVPLHYQPECTTSPKGNIFVDQILMIEILSAALPPGWSLYVKEHVTQWLPWGLNYTSARHRGYYEHVAKIKNVKIVPLEISSCDLIKHSKATATVSGTAGWEAVLRSKPALVFGYPWYSDCHGVYSVKSVESCQNIFEKIVNNVIKVEPQKVLNFLFLLDKISTHMYLYQMDQKISKLTPGENKKNILEVLIKEIESNN